MCVCMPQDANQHTRKSRGITAPPSQKSQSSRASKNKQIATPATGLGCTSTTAKSEERASLFSDDFDAVFVQPRTLLFLSGVQHRFCALHREDIEVGGVRSAVAAGQRDSHLVRGIEHHVIFPQSPRTVEDAEHALLHVHVVGRGAPG